MGPSNILVSSTKKQSLKKKEIFKSSYYVESSGEKHVRGIWPHMA